MFTVNRMRSQGQMPDGWKGVPYENPKSPRMGGLAKVSRKPIPMQAPAIQDPSFYDPSSDPGFNAMTAGYGGAGMGPAAQMPQGTGFFGRLGGLARSAASAAHPFLSAMAAGAAAAQPYGQPYGQPQAPLGGLAQGIPRSAYDYTPEELEALLYQAENDPSYLDARLTRWE